MVAIKPRSNLVKKPKPAPTQNTVVSVSVYIHDVFEAMCANPAITPESLHQEQSLALKAPLEMLRRVHWLLHVDQQSRLAPDVLNEFQKAAWGQSSKDLTTLGLDKDEVTLVRDILERKPPIRQHDGRDIAVADLDQVAMLFLLMRQGASNKAAKTAFRHASPDSTVVSVRREMMHSFTSYKHHAAWNWDDEYKPVLRR